MSEIETGAATAASGPQSRVGGYARPVTSLVRYDVDGKIATITLDSPANRNALSRVLVAGLTGHLAAAGQDRDVRVVVLTHTGSVFCSGADLSEARGGPAAQPSSGAAAGAGSGPTAETGSGPRTGTGSGPAAGTDSGPMAQATTAMMTVMTAIVELDKPVIARVAGHVRAGGMGIVGACDIALASEQASFAFTEARIGLAPAIISLTTLDLMPPRAAARCYLTGETFGARVAAEIGLITQAVAAGGLDEETARIAGQICQTSPQGAAQTKRLLTAVRRRRIAARSAEMTALSARLFASEEAQEGIRAFLERRPPAWQQ